MKKFKIVYAKPIEKDLKGLEVKVIDRLRKALQRLVNNPFPGIATGKTIRKLEIKESTYRLRVGEYRVIYRIETQKIIVLRIIHRKELERELKKLS
ncbi:type II toxin-antitoxin system RelE/ParE family toxin [Candidatus Aerophobetes bacterium]|nr:type II toxin-antitoxin system RelE/ParE family toxin [Candidatus Aerophobetes bacterium]